jgi:putative transposase
LRYARWDLSRVDLVNARTGAVLCAVHPLDKSANADGQRRALSRLAPDTAAPTPGGIAPLLRQLLADYAATGLPPAYLPDPSVPPLPSPAALPSAFPSSTPEQDNNP